MAKRYQTGNQNQYIEEEQTTQWPKDTKQVIRISISKKNRQYNGHKKKYKRTNNSLQNIKINFSALVLKGRKNEHVRVTPTNHCFSLSTTRHHTNTCWLMGAKQNIIGQSYLNNTKNNILYLFIYKSVLQIFSVILFLKID